MSNGQRSQEFGYDLVFGVILILDDEITQVLYSFSKIFRFEIRKIIIDDSFIVSPQLLKKASYTVSLLEKVGHLTIIEESCAHRSQFQKYPNFFQNQTKLLFFEDLHNNRILE